MVVVTSDNGAGERWVEARSGQCTVVVPREGNLPFRGLRGSVLEGGVRVPALVYSPLLPANMRGKRSLSSST